MFQCCERVDVSCVFNACMPMYSHAAGEAQCYTVSTRSLDTMQRPASLPAIVIILFFLLVP